MAISLGIYHIFRQTHMLSHEIMTVTTVPCTLAPAFDAKELSARMQGYQKTESERFPDSDDPFD